MICIDILTHYHKRTLFPAYLLKNYTLVLHTLFTFNVCQASVVAGKILFGSRRVRGGIA